MEEADAREEALSSRLGWFGRLDTAVFRVETVIVVTFLIIMSVLVFTDVMYQSVVGVTQAIQTTGAWITIVAFFSFSGLVVFAATGRSSHLDEEELRPLGARLGITLGVNLGIAVLCYLLLAWESSTVYRLVLLAMIAPAAVLFWKQGDRKKLVTLLVAVILAFWFFGELPTGYAWAQSYSLLLLLWVGFLGASMAARQRRHLRVDLVRKLLSPKWLPHFNAVSYVVAALFTGLICYLGYLYIFGPDSTYLRPIWATPEWLPESLRHELTTGFPLPEDSSLSRRMLQVFFAPGEPGEIPDWLKVLAIPVSMALICIRFLGHSFVFARMAMRGQAYEEELGAH